MNTIYNKLKEYFDTTPEKKRKADWDATKKYDEVGPTIEEFLNYKP